MTPEHKTICKTYGARELHPIGDLCSCGKVHVEPAPVRTCTGQKGCTCSSCTARHHSSSHQNKNTYAIRHLFEDERKHECDFAGTQYDFAADAEEVKTATKKKLADSTSIVLAMEEHERCNHHVPESKLHYGFFGKVKDSFSKRTHQDLKDGYLYRFAGHPISLKRCDKHREHEDHEEEEVEEEEEEFVPYELGYSDIGYGQHKYAERSFVKHHAPEKSYECKDKVHHVHTSSCGCRSKHVTLQEDSSHHYYI